MQGAKYVRMNSNASGEVYAVLNLHYRQPHGRKMRRLSLPVTNDNVRTSVAQLSGDTRFATAVAAFGQKLRGEPQLDGFDYDKILDLAESGLGYGTDSDRKDCLSLVGRAKSLRSPISASRNK